MRRRHRWKAGLATTAAAICGCSSGPSADPRPQPAPQPAPAPAWRLVHHETFDAPFPELPWIEDTYGDDSPYHVDLFDEDGAFFHARGGATFASNLAAFRSFRRSFRYGERGWLTVELYGRDSDRDGTPETGGRFESSGGRARLISARHYDGAIIRSTEPLPPRYRVEVTVSNIQFGGERGGSWRYDGKINGYDGDERADPWMFRDADPAPRTATTQNGLYFLCITDYPRPAPHNNVFIHHHRKVVMDTDNNEYSAEPGVNPAGSWSKVWNPTLGAPEVDGSRYISMMWLNGEDYGHDWNGNTFISYTPGGWQTEELAFVDKYLEGETYTFAVERDGEGYALSVTGRFHHGGHTSYRARRGFRERPVTWHYNQTPAEYLPPRFNQRKTYGGITFDTWPAGSAYPDYFFFGDPHINFYEGSAEFDDVKLYLPAG